MTQVTQIAAHRGGAALWAENSPTAFRNAAAMRVEQIEFDVQLTRDGVPVIHHDATLDRTTSGSGPLATQSLADLKALTLLETEGERVMTLEEGIEILAPSEVILRCEIKPGVDLARYEGLEAKVFEACDRHGILDRVIISSFQLASLQDVRGWARAPGGLLWLVARPVVGCVGLDQVIALAEKLGIGEVGFHHQDLNEETFKTVTRGGLACGAWAVLDDVDIARMLALGVCVFTTDRPDAALAIREADKD